MGILDRTRAIPHSKERGTAREKGWEREERFGLQKRRGRNQQQALNYGKKPPELRKTTRKHSEKETTRKKFIRTTGREPRTSRRKGGGTQAENALAHWVRRRSLRSSSRNRAVKGEKRALKEHATPLSHKLPERRKKKGPNARSPRLSKTEG